MSRYQKGTIILPILALFLTASVAIYLSSTRVRKKDGDSSPLILVSPSVAPTITASPGKKVENITIEEIKALIPNIEWEESKFDLKDKHPEYTSAVTGTELYNPNTNISIRDYFQIIDEEFRKRGWNFDGENPAGGSLYGWGYSARIDRHHRYVTFQYQSDCGMLVPPCKNGNLIFLSD